MTQEQLGEKLGVTNKTISRWENGNYMPDVEMLSLKLRGRNAYALLGAISSTLGILFYVVLYNRMMVFVEDLAYRAVPDKRTETKEP